MRYDDGEQRWHNLPQGMAAGTLRWEGGGGGGGGLPSPRGARGGRGARARGRGGGRKAAPSGACAQSATPAAHHFGSETVWPFPVVVPPEALGHVHGGATPPVRSGAATPPTRGGAATPAARGGAAQGGATTPGVRGRAASPAAAHDSVVAGATVQLRRTPDKRGWASRHLAVLVRRVHGDGTFDAEPPSDEDDVAPWRLDAEPLRNIERVLSKPAKGAATQRPPAAEMPPVEVPPTSGDEVEAPAVARVASFLAAGAAFFAAGTPPAPPALLAPLAPPALRVPPAPPALPVPLAPPAPRVPPAPSAPPARLEALEARIGLPPQTGPEIPRLAQLELMMDCSPTASSTFAGACIRPRLSLGPCGARTPAECLSRSDAGWQVGSSIFKRASKLTGSSSSQRQLM